LRYGEDLDYVRRTAYRTWRVSNAVRATRERLGTMLDTRVTEHPKAHSRAAFDSGSGTMLMKVVDVNTYEALSARDLERFTFGVDSQWFHDQGEVRTFCPWELVAT
jgi:hypothetical protein